MASTREPRNLNARRVGASRPALHLARKRLNEMRERSAPARIRIVGQRLTEPETWWGRDRAKQGGVLTIGSSNRLIGWLRQLDTLRGVA